MSWEQEARHVPVEAPKTSIQVRDTIGFPIPTLLGLNPLINVKTFFVTSLSTPQAFPPGDDPRRVDPVAGSILLCSKHT
jgi:hypothetical protein